jgi:hypothetical protein
MSPRHFETHIIEWEGRRIEVRYEPDWLNRQNDVDSEYLVGHLDIRTIAPGNAPIPITETGYRSHFIHPSIIEDAGGPVAYVLAWIKREAYAPHWLKIQTQFEQPSLFDDL